MLLQFEFMTERARRKFAARQNAVPDVIRDLLMHVPQLLSMLQNKIESERARSGVPIETVGAPEPDVTIEGESVPVYLVQTAAGRLINMSAKLATAGWAVWENDERSVVMPFWRSPKPGDDRRYSTRDAYRSFLLIDAWENNGKRDTTSPIEPTAKI